MTKTSKPNKPKVKTKRTLPKREQGLPPGIVGELQGLPSDIGAAAAAGYFPPPADDDDIPGFERLGKIPEIENGREYFDRLTKRLILEETKLNKMTDDSDIDAQRKKMSLLEEEIAKYADTVSAAKEEWDGKYYPDDKLGGRKTKSKRKTKRKTKKNRKTKSKRKTKRNTKKSHR